jgi:DNA polymerase III subunit epsilon
MDDVRSLGDFAAPRPYRGPQARGSRDLPATPRPGDASDAVAPTGGALIRRAYDALAAMGTPLPLSALVVDVFGTALPGTATAGPWFTLLEPLLRRSPLFSPTPDGLWGLAEWSVAQRNLADVEWAVVDVETTGLAPGRHRLIEAAVVIVRGGELREQYSRLINPDRRIPAFITSFTGITQRMVNRSRRAAEVLPELRSFLGQRVLVGHNVGFDLSFLAYEASRLGLPLGFPDDGIDTIALARRYLTGMRRARLDRLAAALHVPIAERHRALGDARTTAHCFVLLLARAMQEGCETLDDLRQALDSHTASPASLPPARPTGGLYLNPAWRQTFPSRPGVYLMKDERGEVIYVGKAKCLKDRLASYYSQPLGYTRKMDGLLQSVREIETRVLGSELEALLVESRLIKQLQPRYNVQLRNYEHYPFIKVDVAHAFPRVYATREVAADGARYFGPFRSGRVVDATIELLHRVFPVRTCTRALPPDSPASDPCLRYHLKRCPAPCRGPLAAADLGAYRAAVEEMCAFLGGERDDLIDRLRRQMYAAAAQQDFERAARLRDALRDADQVLLGQRLVSGAVDANNLLIAYPAAQEGHAALFLVRHGRLIDERSVPVQHATLRADLLEQLDVARSLGRPPDRVGRAEVDQINIIARWIHHHSDEETRSFFRLPRDLSDTTAVERFIDEASSAIPRALAEPAELTQADALEPPDADLAPAGTPVDDDSA